MCMGWQKAQIFFKMKKHYGNKNAFIVHFLKLLYIYYKKEKNMNSIVYIAEPRYGRYEGIYLFGGEPVVLC